MKHQTISINSIVTGVLAVFPNAKIEFERNADFAYRHGHSSDVCIRVCSGDTCVRAPVSDYFSETRALVQHAVQNLAGAIAHDAMRRGA